MKTDGAVYLLKWVHATPRFALNWTESLAGVLGVVWGHHLWVPITSPGSPLQCEAPCGDLPLNARCLARERLREVAGYGEGSVVVVRCCAEHIYLTAGTQHHLVHHSHFFFLIPPNRSDALVAELSLHPAPCCCPHATTGFVVP